MRRVLVIFIFLVMNGCVQNDKSELTICCAGDSLMRPIPYHLKEMLNVAKRKVDIRDWSQGGLSSVTYQIFFAQHYLRWRKTRPDFILIQLGTNDVIPLQKDKYQMADFKKNLNTIIRNFKRFRGNKYRRPRIFLSSVPLFYGEFSSVEENRLVQKEINPAIEEIAIKEKLFFVDNFSILVNKTHLYSPDGVHPNSSGEIALSKNWLFWIRSELREGY